MEIIDQRQIEVLGNQAAKKWRDTQIDNLGLFIADAVREYVQRLPDVDDIELLKALVEDRNEWKKKAEEAFIALEEMSAYAKEHRKESERCQYLLHYSDLSV